MNSIDLFVLGKSKVFLKYYHAEQLTRHYSTMINAIVRIQSSIRTYLVRLHEQQANTSIINELNRHSTCVRVFVMKQ
jgi:myosin heavy subunit